MVLAVINRSENGIELNSSSVTAKNLETTSEFHEKRHPLRVGILSLLGGQGKTTISLLLGIQLINLGYRVLWVDVDPAGTLSDYLNEGSDINISLADVLQKNNISSAIVTTRFSNGFLVSSSQRLSQINQYLADSGISTAILRKKLKELDSSDLDFIIIDPPPNQNHLSLCAMGATDTCIIPVETTAKGASGLFQTLGYLDDYRNLGAFNGTILGIVPFRERWFGNAMATDSKQSKQNIINISQSANLKIFPSIIESEAYKKAIVNLTVPSKFGHNELDYPLKTIASEIFNLFPHLKKNLY